MAAQDRGKAKIEPVRESGGCDTWKKVRRTALVKFEAQQANLVSAPTLPKIFAPPHEVFEVESRGAVAALGRWAEGGVSVCEVANFGRAQFL